MTESRLLQIPRDRLEACFGREPFEIEHQLATHPLFALDRLVDLACRNSRHVQWHRGDLAADEVGADPDRKGRNTFGSRGFPGNGLGIRETIEAIEHNGSWMLIREIGEIPEYRALLDRYMGEVREHVARIAPGMQRARSDVVISSPGAITPFHLDEEQNFLLQIRGWKTLTVVDGLDPRGVTEQDREAFFAGNGELHPGRVDRGAPHRMLRLDAGRGVHIPSLFPHTVRNGDAVSVSVTTMFFTDATERRRELYRLKAWQQRIGLPAAAVGTHPRLDAAKIAAMEAARRVVAPLRGRRRSQDDERAA